MESGVPMRHPRPMTPAEMHLELEKEQEAIVCSIEVLFLSTLHRGGLERKLMHRHRSID